MPQAKAAPYDVSDCVGHTLRVDTRASTPVHIAVFRYADGCVREFDGVNWRLVKGPTHPEE